MKSNAQMKKDSFYTALTLFSLGLLVILVGQWLGDLNAEIISINLESIFSNMGSFIAIIAVMEWIYETRVRENMFDEITTHVTNSKTIAESGILHFENNSMDCDYAESFAQSTQLDIYVLYSTKILKSHEKELKGRSLSDKKTNIFCLKKDGNTADYLEKAYQIEKNKVENGIDQIDAIVSEINLSKQNIEIKHHDYLLRNTYIETDHKFFLILSTSSKGRTHVPCLTIAKESPMGVFIQEDLERLRDAT